VRFFVWKKYIEQSRFTQVIDLERSLDEIWASFSKYCRKGIKKVNAYSPEIQQTDDVSALLDIWRARFSELGVQAPLLSDSYLKDLVAAFPQDISVYNLTIDGELATAIVCCVMQKERYCYWIGGVNVRKDLGANDYFTWEIVKQAKSEGFTKLDLCPGDARLSRYKAKFDPVLEPLCFVEKTDRLGKTVNFAWKKLSGARKLALDALPRAHL
jgi:lipid II:glycine glycyltransferase (peptidoglycan interpeptide bridge formation enzyme)